MLLFTFILFMFGSALFLLNSKQDGGLEIIDNYLQDKEYTNMMINQYLLTLGDY